jgi:monofunctional biosynthetic peptidoglycan transglycosylase
MLPGPRVAYNPYKNLAKVLRRSDMILRLLRGKGVLSEEEYRLALAEVPDITGLQRKVDDSIKQEEVLANLSSATVPQHPVAAPTSEMVKPVTEPVPAAPESTEPPAGEGQERGESSPAGERKQ